MYLFCAALPGLEGFIFWIADFFMRLGGSPDLRTLLLYSIPYAGFLIAGLIIFTKAEQFGDRLLRGVALPTGPAPSSVEMQALAIAILGLYLATQAFPHLIGSIVQLVFDFRWRGTSRNEYAKGLIGPVLELGLGLALFFQARGISIMWHRLRNAGRYHEPPDERM